MHSVKLAKTQPHTRRWAIGFWATAWWGLTCVFALGLVWFAVKQYVDANVLSKHISWIASLKMGYMHTLLLQISFLILLVGWIIGAIVWLLELRRQNLSYKAAFVDLFLTIRK